MNLATMNMAIATEPAESPAPIVVMMAPSRIALSLPARSLCQTERKQPAHEPWKISQIYTKKHCP
jgi:hypothetical protein